MLLPDSVYLHPVTEDCGYKERENKLMPESKEERKV